MVYRFMQITNWRVFWFILGYHVLALALLPLVWPHFTWTALGWFGFTFFVGGLSITAGYHRLFAHKAYQAHPVLEWSVLLGSLLAFQWSALVWAHDHRLHHKHVDTDKDPYSIKKGFWYAHVLWLFTYKEKIDPKVVGDLLKNPRVVFQDRHYLVLAILFNLAVFGVGCLFLHPWASLYAGVILRILAIHHCTWCINSLAHVWGSRTYARELSAVDNAVLALVTFGEGYHNYHHTFASDYRNGVRWYHFDPTKWLVWTASKLGLASDLRIVDRIRLQQTLLRKDKNLIMEHLAHQWDELSHDLRGQLEEIATAFDRNASQLLRYLQERQKATGEKRRLVQVQIRRLRTELKASWHAWISLAAFVEARYKFSHSH